MDVDKVSEYFEVNHVIEQALKIYQELFSLQIIPIENTKTWQEDVKCYQVKDKNDVLGYFYLDIFDRKNKGGAFESIPLIHGIRSKDGTIHPSVSVMLAKFRKSKETAKPSLLRHHDVTIFFHEIGHIFHQMSTEAKYIPFSGTHVEDDFVEMPS